MLLYVHRDQKDYTIRDGHLDFHTTPELYKDISGSVLLSVHRGYKDY